MTGKLRSFDTSVNYHVLRGITYLSKYVKLCSVYRMTRVSILVLAISLFSTILEAQNHFYSTRNYTVKNGLPQSQVSTLLEDKNGYLWIGTHGGGLARFDGREFKVYTTLDGLLNLSSTLGS